MFCEMSGQFDQTRRVERFATPLHGTHADTSAMKAEFTIMTEYAVQYIALSTLDYHSVWWRLFNAPNSAEWGNVLIPANLLLCLPASNGKLKRAFSLLRTIKTDKRSRLTNQSLDDLLRVLSSKVPLKSFNPDDSIDLWWLAKWRRLAQSERKEYRPRRSQTAREESTSSEIQSESESEDMLEQWDELMNDIWGFFVFFCVTGHMCHLSNHFMLCSDIRPHIQKKLFWPLPSHPLLKGLPASYC